MGKTNKRKASAVDNHKREIEDSIDRDNTNGSLELTKPDSTEEHVNNLEKQKSLDNVIPNSSKNINETELDKNKTEEQEPIVEQFTPPQSAPPPPEYSFKELGIGKWLIDALRAVEIKTPTEIQRACIKPILQGKDVIGGAKTGSGKTAAFALPILNDLSADPYGVFALILTPTRELAIQIAEQFTVFGKSINLKVSVIVGGLDMMEQALSLSKRPHIIVATPGRLADHINSCSDVINLNKLKYLVLDEADRLLTSTFAPDLSVIMDVVPKTKRTLLFTATITSSVLAYFQRKQKEGKEPFVYLSESETKTVSSLDQSYLLVPSYVKDSYLVQLLRDPQFENKSIMLVVNLDIPRDPDEYIHRVGRTARAGRSGKAITVVTENDINLLKSIEERIGKQLDEYKVSEKEVMTILNKVIAARRVSTMNLIDSGFGEKDKTRAKKKRAQKKLLE
ncbi:hypothetical protein BB559_004293 [Furculomyces boomerangus]|uniref:RNA helicase n=2 Tax=Harpellales TaxID=61421 RepID=A0A2T9YFG9_9FUNG|nr:hypothetical protein BB559_004293 [Furculomyces boomerangus]PVZ98914.1 hypothetical protein BB558_005054 [Smittium angustum]PWA02112.1 hypothetical protein BB558_001758 [Smittium angustum]